MAYVTWFVFVNWTASATANSIYVLIALWRVFRKINTFKWNKIHSEQWFYSEKYEADIRQTYCIIPMSEYLAY